MYAVPKAQLIIRKSNVSLQIMRTFEMVEFYPGTRSYPTEPSSGSMASNEVVCHNKRKRLEYTFESGCTLHIKSDQNVFFLRRGNDAQVHLCSHHR